MTVRACEPSLEHDPLLTVVVPVRDEESTIAGCIDSLAAQDLPARLVEVVVVDGGSSDATVRRAEAALARTGWARSVVLHDPVGSRPANLNRGLAAARAPLLCRVDARSRPAPGYLRRCATLLDGRPEVAVVGGAQCAVGGPGFVARGIARALNNRWTTGLARYRRSRSSGPADTVYLGAFRTAQLRAAGGWCADLSANEDFDLNRRMSATGLVWFDAELHVDYLPRTSVSAILAQYHGFGVSKVRYWRARRASPSNRQRMLLAAPLVAGAATAAALLALPASSLALAGGLCLAATLAVEDRGCDGPRGGPLARLVSLSTTSAIAGGWVSGVAAEAVLGGRRHRGHVAAAT